MSENENLGDKLQSLLDAHDELCDFHRIHGETKHTTKQTKPNEFAIGVTGPTGPAEMARLDEAFRQAKKEYEAAIRKDEREQIKALIDEREPQ
jgi:hypothetical protein